MAGWSKTADGSGLNCFKTLQKLQTNDFWFIFEQGSKGSVRGGEQDKLRCLFNQIVSVFLEEICGSRFRPLPPMLGDGHSVDLFKLYFAVREKGGYETVSKNGLWDLVATESGMDSVTAPALKLIFLKYLHTLDKWLLRIVTDKDSKGGLQDSEMDLGGFSMGLESEFKGVLSDILDEKKKDVEYLHLDMEKSGSNFTGVGKLSNGDDIQSFVESDGVKENANGKRSVDDEKFEVESCVVKENDSNRKRKRKCGSPMLDWVLEVAKDPCDLAIGSLPEISKWKSYGSEELWKQVLLAREAFLSKRNIDSSAEQSIWRKKQRMHPIMYDDHTGSERSRCSQRFLPVIESRALPSFKKRVPVGPYFQAEVPDWTGETYESDSKWLGTRVWPLEKGAHSNHLIERDRIGKGRQDSCGCQFPRSIECVRFHVSERRMRVKLELCSAFQHWKFDKMGEQVALSWTREEEKKFQAIVRSNPASLDKCFWDEMFKSFPKKSRGDLVSYYFNVFLLQRRGSQNRSSPSNIDSEDDEPEFGSITNGAGHGAVRSSGSILCSPKKIHLNFR